MRTKYDRQMENREKLAWRDEYARIDAEYNAQMLKDLQQGRSALEAIERAWARGDGQ
jgi:hypothetical protein